jgi:anti-sigma regulatory factor (Ser/Thr protein kinase)
MELKLELDSDSAASAEARSELRTLAGDLSQRTLADLLFIVTELVTNGVKFGPGLPIEVLVDVHEDGSVLGLVGDRGRGGISIHHLGTLESGGMGLQIVDGLASDWGIGPRKSDVWFQLAGTAG